MALACIEADDDLPPQYEKELRMANEICQDPDVLIFLRALGKAALTYLDIRAEADIPGNGERQRDAVDTALVHLSRPIADELVDDLAGRVGQNPAVLRQVFVGQGNLRESMYHVHRFVARLLLPDMLGPSRRHDFWALCAQAGFDLEAGKAFVVDSSCRCLGIQATAHMCLEDMRASLEAAEVLKQEWTQEYAEERTSRKKLRMSGSSHAWSRMSRTKFRELGGIFDGVAETNLISPLGKEFCPWVEGARITEVASPDESAWVAEALRASIPLLGSPSNAAEVHMRFLLAMAGDGRDEILMSTLACLGYFVPIRSHTVHEILLACRSPGRLRYESSMYSAVLSSPRMLGINELPSIVLPEQVPAATMVKDENDKSVSLWVPQVDPSWWVWNFRRACSDMKFMLALDLLEGEGSQSFEITNIDDRSLAAKEDLEAILRARQERKKRLRRCAYVCTHLNPCRPSGMPDFLVSHSWTPAPLDWDSLSNIPYPVVKKHSLRSLCEQASLRKHGDRSQWGSVSLVWDDVCIDSPQVCFIAVEYLHLCRGHCVVLSPNSFSRLWVVLELASGLAHPDVGRLYVSARPFMLAARSPRQMNTMYIHNVREFAISNVYVQNRAQSASILDDLVRSTYVDGAHFAHFFKLSLVVYILRDWCLSDRSDGDDDPLDLSAWAELAREISAELVDAIECLKSQRPTADEWFLNVARPLLVQEQRRALLMTCDVNK